MFSSSTGYQEFSFPWVRQPHCRGKHRHIKGIPSPGAMVMFVRIDTGHLYVSVINIFEKLFSHLLLYHTTFSCVVFGLFVRGHMIFDQKWRLGFNSSKWTEETLPSTRLLHWAAKVPCAQSSTHTPHWQTLFYFHVAKVHRAYVCTSAHINLSDVGQKSFEVRNPPLPDGMAENG